MLYAILMLKLWQLHLEYEYTAKMNQNTHRLRLQTDREQFISIEIHFTHNLSMEIEVLLSSFSKSVTCQTLLTVVLFFKNLITVLLPVLL